MSITCGFHLIQANMPIGIAASVVDENLTELANFFYPIYVPNEQTYHLKYHHDMPLLTYTSQKSSSRDQREKELVHKFQAFRKQWEVFSDTTNKKFELITPNIIEDGGGLNNLLLTHSRIAPIQYNCSGVYQPLPDIYSLQKGLVHAIDPTCPANRYWSKIIELYQVPVMVEHDNQYIHHAYTSAFTYQVLNGILDGRIKRRPKSRILSYLGAALGALIIAYVWCKW